jgi:hypothetical protein
MGDKDPPPFGCTPSRLICCTPASVLTPQPDTFSADFFDGTATPLDTHGQSLLSDMENQSLADFFSNTDPFHLADPHPFPPQHDSKTLPDDYTTWDFVTPPTVHGVSATIPDQAHLHHNFHSDHSFAPSPAHHLGNTHDDLQAASTLFNHAQPSHSSVRSHSFHAPPPPATTTNATTNHAAGSSQHALPMVATSNGMISQQLAAIIPHYAEEGTLDAQLAAQWAASHAHHQLHETEFTPMLYQPHMKRTYSFGTDHSFNNPSGYSAPRPQEVEHQAMRHLSSDMQRLQPTPQQLAGANGTAVTPPTRQSYSYRERQSDDEQSDEATSEEDDDDDGDRPAKKRKKSNRSAGKDSSGKNGTSGRSAKNRKLSSVTESSKKKRSGSAQRLQRENLTEAQKRSNHILSEQKRRNLIKRGFDDLHDLVPEIRNGGLSKSSVLMEAANFLEKLIEDNAAFRKLASGVSADGTG